MATYLIKKKFTIRNFHEESCIRLILLSFWSYVYSAEILVDVITPWKDLSSEQQQQVSLQNNILWLTFDMQLHHWEATNVISTIESEVSTKIRICHN